MTSSVQQIVARFNRSSMYATPQITQRLDLSSRYANEGPDPLNNFDFRGRSDRFSDFLSELDQFLMSPGTTDEACRELLGQMSPRLKIRVLYSLHQCHPQSSIPEVLEKWDCGRVPGFWGEGGLFGIEALGGGIVKDKRKQMNQEIFSQELCYAAGTENSDLAARQFAEELYRALPNSRYRELARTAVPHLFASRNNVPQKNAYEVRQLADSFRTVRPSSISAQVNNPLAVGLAPNGNRIGVKP